MPVFVHHPFDGFTVVNHNTPLCQIAQVQVLRSHVAASIVHNKMLGVQTNIGTIGVLCRSIRQSYVTNAQVTFDLRDQPVWIFVAFFRKLPPDGCDDLFRDLIARPAVAVLRSRRAQVGRDAAWIAQYEFQRNGLSPQNVSHRVDVLNRPTSTRHRRSSSRQHERSDILQGKPNDRRRRADHGSKRIIGWPMLLQYLSLPSNG
mmetsp:Transcript_16980/g.47621  ORF Transcript_16980/g.47621 Transcript_16980/m.47621 type:complete len:203 (+) Transcript_16980:131-739(+)